MNSSMLTSCLTLSNKHTDSIQPKISVNGDIDYLARVSGSTATIISTEYIGETRDFASAIQRYTYAKQVEIDSLLHALDWQHKTIEFNSSYIAMLLGQIDDDEFEAAAEALATVREDKSPSQILPIVSSLLRLTRIPFTASDFAGMLNCSEDTVYKAIDALSKMDEAPPHIME